MTGNKIRYGSPTEDGIKKGSPKTPFVSTAGGNRTHTTSQSQDFESSASTNSATAAINYSQKLLLASMGCKSINTFFNSQKIFTNIIKFFQTFVAFSTNTSVIVLIFKNFHFRVFFSTFTVKINF